MSFEVSAVIHPFDRSILGFPLRESHDVAICDEIVEGIAFVSFLTLTGRPYFRNCFQGKSNQPLIFKYFLRAFYALSCDQEIRITKLGAVFFSKLFPGFG